MRGREETWVKRALSTQAAALRLLPSSAVLLFNQGVLRWGAARHEEAEALYRRAIAAAPSGAQAGLSYNNLGRLLVDASAQGNNLGSRSLVPATHHVEELT